MEVSPDELKRNIQILLDDLERIVIVPLGYKQIPKVPIEAFIDFSFKENLGTPLYNLASFVYNLPSYTATSYLNSYANLKTIYDFLSAAYKYIQIASQIHANGEEDKFIELFIQNAIETLTKEDIEYFFDVFLPQVIPYLKSGSLQALTYLFPPAKPENADGGDAAGDGTEDAAGDAAEEVDATPEGGEDTAGDGTEDTAGDGDAKKEDKPSWIFPLVTSAAAVFGVVLIVIMFVLFWTPTPV